MSEGVKKDWDGTFSSMYEELREGGDADNICVKSLALQNALAGLRNVPTQKEEDPKPRTGLERVREQSTAMVERIMRTLRERYIHLNPDDALGY